MDKLKAKFLEEAIELVDNLEKALLVLENNEDDKQCIEEVFRVMHTLKGTSAMFGFESVGDFTHHLESIYDLIRGGTVKLTTVLLSTTLASVDHLRNLLEDPEIEEPTLAERHQVLSQQIIELAAQMVGTEAGADGETKAEVKEKVETYYVFFAPKPELFANGTNPLYLIEELYMLDGCHVEAHFSHIPDLENTVPEHCQTYWEAVVSSTSGENLIRDVFIFVEDDSLLKIEKIADFNIPSKGLPHELIEKLAEELPSADNVELATRIEDIKRLVANIVPDEAVPLNTENLAPVAETPPSVDANKKTGDKAVKKVKREKIISSVRVSSEKLDETMNLVSELVTTQVRLSLFAEQSGDHHLVSIAEDIEKLSRKLRDNAFSMSLVPLENILVRFRRLVRDLSSELEKEVDFVVIGADTEMDKNIIESLIDPLLHLIRNCMDHGIEAHDERIAAGKDKKGKITLKAYYSGTNVHIQIIDDGRGLDTEKIHKKAVKKGLVDAHAELSDREIMDLVLLPGFTTNDKVTELSGRGVGMDVVNRKIADLRGEVELKSEKGIGTAVTIKLPLTLSIIEGLLTQINQTNYVIPLSSVFKCHEIETKQLNKGFNDLVVLDGEQIPYFNLRKHFMEQENVPELSRLVVVWYEDKRIALSVDHIVGEYQAALKPLGKLYKEQQFIAGGSILGDGTVALVLDTNKMIKEFLNENSFAV